MRRALLLPLLLSCAAGPLTASDSISFFTPPQAAGEGTTLDVVVVRTGSGAGAVGASVAVSGGVSGAALGVDFSAATPASLSWADGDVTPRVVHVPILHDPAFTPWHSVHLALSAPTGGALIDPGGGVVDVPISEADPNPAGTIGLVLPDASGRVAVRDDAGSVTVDMVRGGGTSGAVSVDLFFADEDALAGTDYAVPGSVTLNWADGEAGHKTLAVPILPRSPAAGPREFSINAFTTGGGASLGPLSGVAVTVLDHLPALAGTLACPSALSVRELAGPAVIRVARLGGSTGAVSIDWTTNDSSALAGTNYLAGAGTLSWADGDSGPRTITVPILADGIAAPTLYANVSFANPTGGLIVPAGTSCSLAILDGDGAAGLLGFSETVLDVREDAGQALALVTRSGGAQGAVSVDWSTSDGSAVSGAQYSGGSGTLSWADGDAAPKAIAIPIHHDGAPGPGSAFYIDLANPSGGAAIDFGFDGRYEIVVAIADVDFPVDTIAWSASALTVHELDGSVTLTATRSGAALGPVSALAQVRAGSATPGVDYAAADVASLDWAAGDLAPKSVTIPLLHNGQASGARGFRVVLGPASGGALTALPNAAAITILDDDPAPAGQLAFAPAALSASAASGAATLTVTRRGGTQGAVAVDWSTVFASPASARPGVDAVAATGTLSWADGDGAPKPIPITLLDSGEAGLDRTLLVRLAGPAGGAILDASAGTVDATITITAAAPAAGRIALPATLSAAHALASLAVPVQRSGGSAGAVSVDFATGGETAQDGVDFQPAYGTVSWAAGDTAPKTITVPLQASAVGTPARTLYVTLTDATGGAVISGAQTRITLLAPQAITFPAIAGQTYGAAPVTLSASASSSLAPTFSVVSGPGLVSGGTLTITGAGAITVAADQPGDATFAAAPQALRTIASAPAALTITADDQTRAAGAANPVFTASVTGFVRGDGVSHLATPIALATTATPASPPGSYPITASAASSPDYAITFAPGTLTVSAAGPTPPPPAAGGGHGPCGLGSAFSAALILLCLAGRLRLVRPVSKR